MSPRKFYQKLLNNHFYLVQCIQTGFLMGLSDVLAQQIVEKRPLKKHNVKRTAEFAFLGCCLVGPAVTAWYKFLHRTFGSEKNARTTLKKVAVDQLVFAPGFLVIFLTSVGILHKKDRAHIKKDFETKFVDIVTTNWTVWPAVQLINFYFLPLKYEVLFAQTVALCWNTYLTWKTGQDD